MHVQSLSLHLVKTFKSLQWEFDRPSEVGGGLEGINVIVGGNASGKSTILKAIGLALAGPNAVRSLMPSVRGWLHREASPPGGLPKRRSTSTALAKIEVCVTRLPGDKILGSGGHKTKQVTLGVQWNEFERSFEASPGCKAVNSVARRGPWAAGATGWFVAGYGPMRRLSGSSNEATRVALAGGKQASLVSLFYEDAALSESELWLKDLQLNALQQNEDAAELLAHVSAFLNDGLLPQGFRIETISSEVYLRNNEGLKLPMRDLSDGCRSVYALILDIVRQIAASHPPGTSLFELQNDRLVVALSGVVLIDELEDHLHPSWQRRICAWLKERFPKIQFFIATHSPLIVQQADPGGIFVLPLPGEHQREARRLSPHEYNRIAMGRAEKVLLGRAFGLHDTRSDWALKKIAEWELLDAKRRREPLNRAEVIKYKLLEQQMEFAFEDAVK